MAYRNCYSQDSTAPKCLKNRHRRNKNKNKNKKQTGDNNGIRKIPYASLKYFIFKAQVTTHKFH